MKNLSYTFLRPAAEEALGTSRYSPKKLVLIHTGVSLGVGLVLSVLSYVLDLGIDVAPATIVERAKAENIKIVALSGVLTLALDSMKATVDALKAAGLDCKVIIGGAPVSAEACKNIGADEWAHSPAKTVTVCKQWASE